MTDIRELLNQLFNWKKHPASVFFLAIPLAVIGFGALAAHAVLMLVWKGDPWYLAILGCGIGLLCLGLWPTRRAIVRAAASIGDSHE